jgi:peptidoglycan-associated lipoprotein
MKHKVILIALVVTVFGIGCRSRDTRTPQVVPAPTPTPEVAQQIEPDFVPPRMDEETLPSDMMELTRMAHERGWIRDAFFAFDDARLDADAQDALRVSAQWLRQNPDYRLTVEGHCDERGTESYNLALGDRRAGAARDYLVSLGIDSARIRTVSYGEERPFQEGSNEAAWAQNRRAHLVLTR